MKKQSFAFKNKIQTFVDKTKKNLKKKTIFEFFK